MTPILASEPPILDFFVAGIPQTGGSKKAFYRPGMRFAVVTDANPNAQNWKAVVALTAKQNWVSKPPMDVPLCVSYEFTMPRPKNHFRTGANSHELKPNAPTWHVKHRQDTTKLIRPTEDALTGILWADDGVCCEQHGYKRYGEIPGCRITVRYAVNRERQ